MSDQHERDSLEERGPCFSAQIAVPDGPMGDILSVTASGLCARFSAGAKLPPQAVRIPLKIESPDRGISFTVPASAVAQVTSEAVICVRFSCRASSDARAFEAFLTAYYREMSKCRGSSVEVVEDDPSGLRMLRDLLASVGITSSGFSSAAAFLATHKPNVHGCRVFDVRLAGRSGVDLFKDLTNLGCQLPTVFVTGYATVEMAVDAMRSGAHGFLQKPINDQALIDAVHDALQCSATGWRQRCEEVLVQARLGALTSRECDVLAHIVKGDSSKLAAVQLGISKKTVDHHRASIMRKLQVGSMAELVAVALQAPGL